MTDKFQFRGKFNEKESSQIKTHRQFSERQEKEIA